MDRSYFDHNATTPISPEVLEVHVQALLEVYGNASSIHHHGQTAKQKLETARRQVCDLVGCKPRQAVFLSGGTEADNLAIFGRVCRHTGAYRHVITTAIEHPAVLSPCARLEREGVTVTYVRPGPDGIVDPDEIRRAMRPHTVLISVMHVNNEVGTIQPIAEITDIAHDAGVLMHSDGVQAAGRIPIEIESLGVDLYSISGHKLYAPKGIGVLFILKGTKLQPLILGGRHEQERRGGTENVPGAVALGAAAVQAKADLEQEMQRLATLRDRLEQGVVNAVPGVTVNGDRRRRVPNTTNLCFEGIEGEAMVIALDLRGFSVSSGAACSSGVIEPSHVLMAMGLSREQARSSVRFSLGRSNTMEQVDALIEAAAEAASHLRRISPTYANA
ncbi:MAG: cysteine desulfurase family protein [Bryobacteraceae bacterium]